MQQIKALTLLCCKSSQKITHCYLVTVRRFISIWSCFACSRKFGITGLQFYGNKIRTHHSISRGRGFVVTPQYLFQGFGFILEPVLFYLSVASLPRYVLYFREWNKLCGCPLPAVIVGRHPVLLAILCREVRFSCHLAAGPQTSFAGGVGAGCY